MTLEEYLAAQAQTNPNFEAEWQLVQAKHAIYTKAIERPRARKRLLIRLLDAEIVRETTTD
ncbi:hypothetical protein EQG49_12565 [Periweissella cryptocerci]|uniref:Uncharacterized protein n=1 Tax=Periweissella cryptocerci TaxID=2506420 RepID=A0A4P6YWL3_9LACO|nr:hypothetical protein [Periweissella cryptocerci]QBO37230.1 hypothetical protein EQG49_12565 [Periweissella cryptocerci]